MIGWIPYIAFTVIFVAAWKLQIDAQRSLEKSRITSRLWDKSGQTGYTKELWLGVVGLLTNTGLRIAPKNTKELEKTTMSLERAGFQNEEYTLVYYGLKAGCAILFGVGSFSLLLYTKGMSGQTAIVAYGMAMIGFYFPYWGLKWIERRRARQIFHELPDAIDILLVCMNAGLSFDRALQRVSREMEFISPILANEFRRYFFEVESGISRQRALSNMAERNRIDTLTGVINVLVQSVRYGTDIANALRVYADSMRLERKQYAEEKAAKVSTKLVFPTVLFIMPALMVVVMGPAGIRLLERLREIAW